MWLILICISGVKLPNISILLPIVKTQIKAPMGDKTMNVAGRSVHKSYIYQHHIYKQLYESKLVFLAVKSIIVFH